MKRVLEIVIDPQRNPSPSIDVNRGMRVSLSPFDMPTLASFIYDETSRHFRIEFKYLTPDEPKDWFIPHNDVYFETGKISKKLYAIGVKNLKTELSNNEDLASLIEEFAKSIESALSKWNVQSPVERLPFLNFSMARNFLTQEKDDLPSRAFSLLSPQF